MIAANECVATHIYFMNLPFIYRVHEVPKEEKIRSFLGFIGGLGYQINGNLKDNNPKSIQRLIKFLEDKKEFKILSKLLLRSMQKAVYKPVNLGQASRISGVSPSDISVLMIYIEQLSRKK